MRKKISKFLLMVLVPVVMFMTAGILSFSNISGAYSSARALSGNGGVVYVGANSTFNMTSGGISGSKATNGGAVYVAPNGTFNMSGGSIYGNIATNNGNNINNAGTFTMTGGTVGGKTIYTRVDENNKENALGDYILFGSYPKTIKADGITINENDVDDYGYYLGSDGARYAKVNATPRMNTYVYSDGTTIVKDVEYYFKVEPIKWRILSESNGEAILLAEDVLNANIPFYNTSSKRTINEETIYANNYEYSTIRAWLNSYNGTKYSVTDYSSFSAGDYQNNGFYNQAFSQREKDIILTSVVNNSKITTDSSSNPYESNNTNDKIWMLSYKDAINSIYGFGTSAFNYEKTRKKLATDYALANNVYLDDSNGYWKLRSPDTSYDVSWCVRGSGQIYGAYVTFTGAGVAPALKINLNASTYVNDDITSGYSIYNTGTMNLYGGDVYDSIYSSSNINTKMAANIAGTMHLADGATITIEDYAGTTPEYSIVLNSSRNAGTVVTFKGSTTKPDISKISVSGFDGDFEVALRKNSSGYWELFTTYFCLPTTWKTEIASTDYMTTTVNSTAITSVKFVFTAPTGYVKKGTLSTGLDVYLNSSSSTDIAFVSNKIIYAPESCFRLFYTMISVSSFEFTNFNTSHVTDMYGMFELLNPSQNAIARAGERDDSTRNTSLTTLDLHAFDTSNVTDMSYMFAGCQAMKSVNLDGFDTSKVTDMIYMFRFCSSLETLDLSMFNTSSLIYIDSMFIDCSGLISLDLSSFNLSNVSSHTGGMLDFGTTNKIETLKTPYNNVAAIRIQTGSTLYNAETGEVVTTVPANTTKSLTYVNQNPFSYFPSTWKTEVASTTYMTTTLTTSNLTSVKFAKSVPSGYTQVGTLSTKLPVFANTDKTGIAFVANKIYAPANSYQLFKCGYITELDIGVLDTSKVTNMREMFYGVRAGEIDISGFDTSNVTTMNSMFHSCWNVKSLDFSNFNTSKVTDMALMFYNCIALTDIDLFSFNTSKVTIIGSMFYNCKALKTVNLKSFNTAKVTQMERVFYGCLAIESLDLKNFDTSSVGYFDGMFEGCTLLKTIDLSSFDTAKAIRLGNMFYNCENIESLDLSHFVGTNLDSVHSMFKGMKSLKYLDISNMNLSKVTSYTDMLNFSANNYIETLKTPYGCKYDLAITSGSKLYNVETGERVTTISANTASSMTLVNIIQSIDLPSDWQTQVASATYNMKEAVTVANLTSVKFVSTVPAGYTKIGELLNNLPVYANADRTAIAFVARKKITAPADSTELFYNLTSVTSFDFEVFDTSSVTDMTRMFMNCNKLVDVDFGTFNTENVTKMNYMFRSCSSLVTLDLSSFNTAKVQDMNSMFSVCGSLVSLNVSSFDTSKVNDMTSMFSSCSKLVNISLANFNTCNVSLMDSMFFSCSSLVNLDLSNFDTTNLHSVSYMFSYCAGLKTLDLSSFNLIKVSQYMGMLNFSENNHIETFKTPYGCKVALAITSGSTLYNESGVVVSTILANASASMTLSSTPPPVTFPTDWRTQLTGSTMTTTIVADDLTSIAFEKSVPTGYTQIGTIATSILVYKSTSVDTDIVFVYAGKIKAPVDSSSLFKGLTKLVNLTFNNFDTSDTTNMYSMFMLSKLSSQSGFIANAIVNPEKVNTYNTTLENLDLSMFNTLKVINMSAMFYGCKGLKTLDCSSFDMSNVTNLVNMFYFTKDNKIETLKLPYNNSDVIEITTGSELFGDTADQVTLIPANNVKGKVLGTKVSIHFVFTQRNFGVDTPAGIAEIKSGSSSVKVLKVRRGMSWEEICDEYNLVAVGQTLSGENMTTAKLKENAYKWWTIFGEVEGTEKNPIFRKGGTVSEIGVDGFKIEFFYDSMYCLSVDTEIDVYDEKRKKRIRKKLRDISYKDKLLVWNFDKGCFDLATPLFITKPQTTTRYTMVWFSDGSSLRLVGADDTRRHRVFCLETGKFEYVGNGAKVGMTTYNDKGEFVKITKIEFINEKIEFMNIITNEHFNCFANGILTSCKLSNMYPIKNMKYDKTNKTLNTRDMFKDISDYYYKALRLAEQPLLNTYNDHSEYIDYKQIYEIEWENSSFKRDEK